jgi:hypothetical protein
MSKLNSFIRQDVVEITFDEDTFTIIEYVPLGLNDKTKHYPLENKPSIFKIMDTIKLKESFYFNRQNSIKLFHIYNEP